MTTPSKPRPPMTWTKKNIHKLKRVIDGDVFTFDTPKGPLTYEVECRGQQCNSDHPDGYSAMSCSFGLFDGNYETQFGTIAFGAECSCGCWPCAPGPDHFAQTTKLVKLLVIGGRPLANAIARATGKKPPTKRELAAQAKAEKAARAEAELKAKQEALVKAKADAERAKALDALTDQSRRVVTFFRANPSAFGCNRDWVRGLCCALTGEEITTEMIK